MKRTPEFAGGHPKSNGKANVANPSPGIVVGSQAPSKIEYKGNPKSISRKGFGSVVGKRPLD